MTVRFLRDCVYGHYSRSLVFRYLISSCVFKPVFYLVSVRLTEQHWVTLVEKWSPLLPQHRSSSEPQQQKQQQI